MTDDDIQKTRMLCSEVIEERIKSFRTTLKWCVYVAGMMILLLVPGWFFADGKMVYRSLHSAAFPMSFKKDTVLITAYTKDFILRSDGKNEKAYLKFYAEKGQKVQYLLTIENQLRGEGDLQKFTIIVDDDKLNKKSIQKFQGTFKPLKIRYDNDDPETPNDIHKIAFELDKEQADVDHRQILYITCLIHVYGKQYEL